MTFAPDETLRQRLRRARDKAKRYLHVLWWAIKGDQLQTFAEYDSQRKIVELLTQQNEILEDLTFKPVEVRTSLPKAKWRSFGND